LNSVVCFWGFLPVSIAGIGFPFLGVIDACLWKWWKCKAQLNDRLTGYNDGAYVLASKKIACSAIVLCIQICRFRYQLFAKPPKDIRKN
jgi:hypothetical protein